MKISKNQIIAVALGLSLVGTASVAVYQLQNQHAHKPAVRQLQEGGTSNEKSVAPVETSTTPDTQAGTGETNPPAETSPATEPVSGSPAPSPQASPSPVAPTPQPQGGVLEPPHDVPPPSGPADNGNLNKRP
jgi:hypothetical protein